jgi:tetratricopeptide (TPR) repeat protein
MDATRHYSTRDAARILNATEARVRNWARLGGLVPESGPDGRTEFTFQQLLLLRTTRGLIDAGVPARRVRRIWSSLRRQLAADLPLTSVRILADGERAIAWDENASWQPDSGQFLLDFDATEISPERERSTGLAVVSATPAGISAEQAGVSAEPAGAVKRSVKTAIFRPGSAAARATRPPEPVPPSGEIRDPLGHTAGPSAEAAGPSAEQWFHLGSELEESSPLEARQAYLQALVLDPRFADAHLNLGRLAHEAGDLANAEERYREALGHAPDDATCHFNLGVLLEDLGRPEEALRAYRDAIAKDPDAADAHYNLGLLLESKGHRPEAMRHLMTAHRLYKPAK